MYKYLLKGFPIWEYMLVIIKKVVRPIEQIMHLRNLQFCTNICRYSNKDVLCSKGCQEIEIIFFWVVLAFELVFLWGSVVGGTTDKELEMHLLVCGLGKSLKLSSTLKLDKVLRKSVKPYSNFMKEPDNLVNFPSGECFLKVCILSEECVIGLIPSWTRRWETNPFFTS